MKQVYGWSDTLIGVQANTAGIAFTVTIPFWAWVIDTKGARVTIVAGCLLLTICGLLRCIPVPTHYHGAVVLVCIRGLKAEGSEGPTEPLHLPMHTT
jgi:MFS family permease